MLRELLVIQWLLIAGTVELSDSTVSDLVGRGKFVEAEAIITSWTGDVDALESEIVRGLGEWRSALREIVGLGVKEEVYAPAFRWAQNDTAIFLEVKFSPTLSAPTNTDAAVDGLQVVGRQLDLTAANGRGKRWDLGLTFWGDVLESNGYLPEASAGRAAVTIKKAPGSAFRWPRLQQCDVPNPPNAGLWLDMQESFGFSEDNDDDDDDDRCHDLDAVLKAKQQKNKGDDNKKDEPAAKSKSSTKKKTTTTKKKEKSTTTKTTPTETASTTKKDDKEAKVKEVKKQASAARKAVKDETAKRKKKIESEGKAAVRRAREDRDARLGFEPPSWYECPNYIAVRDGVWDLYHRVSDAHRAGTTAELKQRGTRVVTYATLGLVGSLSGALLVPVWWLRCAFGLGLVGAGGTLGVAKVLLGTIERFQASLS